MSRPFMALLRHEEELRDPTREELYNGPKREKLPTAIQQLPEEETACTFCGVSYFVFSEVQELQATVKKYKKTFHEFVRFMERERRISQELKAQVTTMKKSFEEAAAVFGSNAKRLALESEQLRAKDALLTTQLQAAQRDADHKQSELMASQAQFRRTEEEWRLASALTEQKLRNEILHLSSQLEKTKLLTASQESEFLAEMERERAKIKELEIVLASSRASMSSMERQLITERDQLKQQLLAATERIEVERETAKQLETQLRAVQNELQRIVASSNNDKSAFAQLHDEMASLKQQILQLERSNAALVVDRADLKEQLDKSSDQVRNLRAEIPLLEKKMDETAANMEKRKQEYVRELEKMRLEHGQAISRMQWDHQKALDDLKDQQKAYIEYLQNQTSDAATATTSAMQTALLEMENRLGDSDKQLTHWKHQTQQAYEELQSLRLSSQQSLSRTQSLERQLEDIHGERKELQEEVEHLQQQLEERKASTKQQVEATEREVKAQQAQHAELCSQLQKQLDAMQAKYERLQREHEQSVRQAKVGEKLSPQDDGDDDIPPRVHQAWGDGEGSSRNTRTATSRATTKSATSNNGNNQEQHELEKVVDMLRQSLEQKDKEISLLQQTVHRECLERTSLLEKMRSGKVLPDVCPSTPVATFDPSTRRSSATPRRDQPTTTNHTEDEDGDDRQEGSGGNDPNQPKASFYERLRRAGQRKSKPRRT